MNCLCPITVPDKVLHGFGYKDAKLLVPCGHCAGCAKDRRNDWFVRLWSEYKSHNLPVWFVTISINPFLWPGLNFTTPGVEHQVTPFIRSWKERFRYLNHGVMPKNFLCSEFGSNGKEYVDTAGNIRITTGALHFHGLIFGNFDVATVGKGLIHTHGYTKFERLRGPECIRYVVKYVTKDYSIDNPLLRARTFCSPNIGDPSYYFGDSPATPFVSINGFHYRTPRYFIDKQWSKIYGKDSLISDYGMNRFVLSRAWRRIDRINSFYTMSSEDRYYKYLHDVRSGSIVQPASLERVIQLIDLRLTGPSQPTYRFHSLILSNENYVRMLESDRSFSQNNPIYLSQPYERSETVVPLSLDLTS